MFVVARLLHTRLLLKYPAFTAWLAADVAKSLLLISIPVATNRYLLAWTCTQPVMLALQVWAVIEVYGYTTRAYPLLGSFGRWVLMVGLGLAVLIAAMPLVDELRTTGEYGYLYRFVGFALRRIVTTGLAVFMLTALAMFAVVPIPERRNVRRHRWLLTGYFAASALITGALMRFGGTREASTYASIATLGMSALMYGAWALLLHPKGELVEPTPDPSPEELELAEAYLAETLPALKRMARHPFRPRA
jgi:hypothetical protein